MTGEDKLLHSLRVGLEVVKRWERLTGTESGAWEAAPGSDLAQDNALTHPIEVSPAPWAAILAAVSHLGTLRDSIFHLTGPNAYDAWLHTHGQLTLVRGALENSSMALWLLEPDVQADRILRRIQKDWDERSQLDKVATEIGNPLGEPMAVYEQKMVAILTQAGADATKLKRAPRYGDVVKTAGSLTSVGEKVAFVLWKASSAIAHGELRAILAYLKKEQVTHDPLGGMSLAQVSSDVQLLTVGCLAALTTTKAALASYAKRSGTPITI